MPARASCGVIRGVAGASGLLLVLEAVFMTRACERARAALFEGVLCGVAAAARAVQRAWGAHRGQRLREAALVARELAHKQTAQRAAAVRLQAWARSQNTKNRAAAVVKKQVCGCLLL